MTTDDSEHDHRHRVLVGAAMLMLLLAAMLIPTPGNADQESTPNHWQYLPAIFDSADNGQPPTFPPAPTATATPRVTPTPTSTSPATGSPTPTPTATQACRPGVVSGVLSALSAGLGAIWADGSSLGQVTLDLRDECDVPIVDATPSLASSRGGTDTIAPVVNGGSGQYVWQISSQTVGTSRYEAEVQGTVVAQAAALDFVCVTGQFESSADPQKLGIAFSHPSLVVNPSNRRLRSLGLTWPATGGRQFVQITFGPIANVVWEGNAGVSPFSVGPSDWTSSNRVLITGTERTVLLAFNYAIAATGSYSVVSTWDDGSAGSVCSTPPLSSAP